jgi:hypothetical protein
MATKFTKKQINQVLPKYVKLKTNGSGGSCMRLYNPEQNQSFGWKDDVVEYHRDGGSWSVDIRIDNGKFFSVSHHEGLNNIELIPISYTEWKKSNVGYIDKGTVAYSL